MSGTASANASPSLGDASTSEKPPGVERMSWQSRGYLGSVIGTAAVLALLLAPHTHTLHDHWRSFALLTTAAAVAQLFTVRKPGFQALKPSIVFVLAATILLPIQLLPLFTILQYLPEWLKTRSMAKVASFNVANGIIDAVAAGGVFAALAHTAALPGSSALRFAVGGLAACVVYVGVNHSLLAVIISLTLKQSLRATGLFAREHLTTDFVIGGLGVGVATLGLHDVWVTPFLVLPLILIQRALAIPQLQAEARVDAKTGLYNTRYFMTTLAAEFARAARFERPMALIMADLDLLREINNNYGHLAGDAVLKGIAETFRSELRHYDVPARFGGEEFSILLPETTAAEALEIAERIRRRIAEREFVVSTSTEPLHATVSMGIAGFPEDGAEANELIHQADLAVYRAKLQGRNRVLAASSEPMLVGSPEGLGSGPSVPPVQGPQLRAVPDELEPVTLLPLPEQKTPAVERRQGRPKELPRLRFLLLPTHLAVLIAAVNLLGLGGGFAGLVWGSGWDFAGLGALMLLVGVGQALSLELTDLAGSISVGVVGSIAGAALFDYRAALPLALATVVVDWGSRRTSLHHVLYNVGALTLASLAAAGVFSLGVSIAGSESLAHALVGVVAGGVYFGVNMTLLSLASGFETGESPWSVFRERCVWLLPHYLVYGFVGGMIAVVYASVGVYALAVFAVPLLLMRKSQEAYITHTERANEKLRDAAETIRAQNVSLEAANRLLRERSTAAMESLSATVDARDAYTAGHSRRVQQLTLALGRELELSPPELELLDRAALFHDIGKLAVPDAVLLKPGSLTEDEWHQIQRHAEEGARIIERLGFLQDAVPSIRHHHERFDGSGYPDGLAGEEIPLGARIIHVADALDSMLTTRIYRAARPLEDALAEIRRGIGTQFCPRCVGALERLLPIDQPVAELHLLNAAS